MSEPTDEALQAVLHRIITRLMKLLTPRKVLVEEEEGSTYFADNDDDWDEARVLRTLQMAACTYRIAFGPRAGQKVLTSQDAMPRETDFKQALCADSNGFSLHAAVRCTADDRDALEQLRRTITRPAQGASPGAARGLRLRHPCVTVQATRQPGNPGRWGRLRPRNFGTDERGPNVRDNP